MKALVLICAIDLLQNCYRCGTCNNHATCLSISKKMSVFPGEYYADNGSPLYLLQALNSQVIQLHCALTYHHQNYINSPSPVCGYHQHIAVAHSTDNQY